jgi:hypothetical protein
MEKRDVDRRKSFLATQGCQRGKAWSAGEEASSTVEAVQRRAADSSWLAYVCLGWEAAPRQRCCEVATLCPGVMGEHV